MAIDVSGGGYGSSVTQALKGDERIRVMGQAAPGAQTPMATPPTITLAATVSPAASTKNIPSNNGAFNSNCPTNYNAGSGVTNPLGPLYANGTRHSSWGQGWVRRFDFDGRYFSLRINQSATMKLRLWVNEQPSSADLVSQSTLTGYTGTGNIWMNVDLGSRSIDPRRIMIEIEDTATPTSWGSMEIDPRDTVTPPAIASPRLLWVGDSYGQGNGANLYSHAFNKTVAWKLGIIDMWNWCSLSSTGLVKTNGADGNYQSRSADVYAAAATTSPGCGAIVVIQASLNDAAYIGTGQIAAAFYQYVSGLRSAARQATIIATSVPYVATPNAAYITVSTEVQNAAINSRVPFIDLITPTAATTYYSGTGTTAAPTGDGNADYYRAADGVHPSDNGHLNLGHVFAQLLGPVIGQTL
jgi:lysophospholipase L1-like esterase